MRCPIRPQDRMVEIADGLFQCPWCGLGPTNDLGYRRFWALYNVERIGDTVESIVAAYHPTTDSYSLQPMSWTLERGCREDLEVGELLVIPENELSSFPLPALIKGRRAWKRRPGTGLSRLMFQDPLGPKEIDPP